MPPPSEFRLPRFYPILDSDAAARHGIDPLRAASEILEAGAEILQFRHKGFFSREIFETAERMARLSREAGVVFVVNDRADLARLFHAALHLGQDDITPSQARRVTGPDTIIGFSTHNDAQFRAASLEPAGYLALGPIFETASKLNPDPVVGIPELRRLRPLTAHPVVAIGGITRENAAQVLDAGADSVAVIGDLFSGQSSLPQRIRSWLAATR